MRDFDIQILSLHCAIIKEDNGTTIDPMAVSNILKAFQVILSCVTLTNYSFWEKKLS